LGIKRVIANRHYRNRGGYEQPEGGIDFKAAAHQKILRGDVTELFMLSKEKAGHQEPAQHKEKIDTDPSAAKPDFRKLMKKWADFNRTDSHVSPENKEDC
jgi:hypothetical protein